MGPSRGRGAAVARCCHDVAGSAATDDPVLRGPPTKDLPRLRVSDSDGSSGVQLDGASAHNTACSGNGDIGSDVVERRDSGHGGGGGSDGAASDGGASSGAGRMRGDTAGQAVHDDRSCDDSNAANVPDGEDLSGDDEEDEAYLVELDAELAVRAHLRAEAAEMEAHHHHPGLYTDEEDEDVVDEYGEEDDDCYDGDDGYGADAYYGHPHEDDAVVTDGLKAAHMAEEQAAMYNLLCHYATRLSERAGGRASGVAAAEGGLDGVEAAAAAAAAALRQQRRWRKAAAAGDPYAATGRGGSPLAAAAVELAAADGWLPDVGRRHHGRRGDRVGARASAPLTEGEAEPVAAAATEPPVKSVTPLQRQRGRFVRALLLSTLPQK
eukprot:TRINITY_DN1951_c0_g1_i4.p1 TRINITY_DN1951_c0_g1~~TRINITY_DN1951_c0_g1_i4.p1  ORF type:complete len:380 (+),score=92.19 TRINITY_DN1951_c0_g1_i4:643-1782(+)